jgi:hypothetical protein
VLIDFDKKKPLTSKSINTKETSHFEVIKHKKKPLTSKSFNTKRNHSNDFEERGFFLCGMILRREVSFCVK